MLRLTTSLTIYRLGLRGNNAHKSTRKHRFWTRKPIKSPEITQKIYAVAFGTRRSWVRSPSPRPKQPYHHWWYGCFRFYGLRRGARVGAVLREQNALPYEAWIMKNLTAKDDVDNVGAGRAAKGANPVASTKNSG